MITAEILNEMFTVIAAYPKTWMTYWLMDSLMGFLRSQQSHNIPAGVESLMTDDMRRIVLKWIDLLWPTIQAHTEIFQSNIMTLAQLIEDTDRLFLLVTDVVFNPQEYDRYAVFQALGYCDKYGWPPRLEAVKYILVEYEDNAKVQEWLQFAHAERELEKELYEKAQQRCS